MSLTGDYVLALHQEERWFGKLTARAEAEFRQRYLTDRLPRPRKPIIDQDPGDEQPEPKNQDHEQRKS